MRVVMEKRLTVRSTPEAVIINMLGIRGVSTFHKHQPITRAPEKCCRRTVVGYTQCLISHDGSNPLLGRQAWVAHIAHKPSLTVCERHIEDHVYVYLIRPDDLITSITLAQSALQTEDMQNAIPGLWQIIAFHRPGVRGELYLPRLLVPFAPMEAPKTNRLQ
jgi:hypothetical protein